MISYYDLLGLIKEGKQPDKVKYNGIIFDCIYCNYVNIHAGKLIDYINDAHMFNEGIEIIEEKPKEIEEIELDFENDIIYFGEDRVRYIGTNRKDRDVYIPKINELIDKVNYLLKEGKHE